VNKVSKHNTYFDSDGNTYTQSQVDRYIRLAKAQKIQDMQDAQAYWIAVMMYP